MEELNPDHLKYMPHQPGEEETRNVSSDSPPPLPEHVVNASRLEEVESQPEKVDAKSDKQEYEKTESRDGNMAYRSDVKKEEQDEATSKLLDSWANTALAAFIYNFLSPLIIPTIATLFIFLLSLLAVVAPLASLPYSLTVFGATCLLPGIAFIILLKTGFIHSYQLTDRSDRVIPYVIEFLVFGAMAIFFIFKGASPWIWTIFCGGSAIAMINMLINFRMRISNHCSAMAALLAVLIVIQTYGVPPFPLFWWLVGTALFCGIIGSLAIIRGKHSLWEVLAGYATGFLSIILFSLIH